MDVRGSESGFQELTAPGALVDGRFRVSRVVDHPRADTVVCAAMDERTRQRVRLRIGPARPDPRVLKLRHPLLAPVVASGIGTSTTWVATAWFEGAPLRLPDAPLAGRTALLSWAGALSDVLDLLELVHGALGRAHGALGLRSFWVASDGRLRLVDATGPDRDLRPADLAWAPPERSLAPTTDPRSDLYAVASVFYALATGRAPFGLDPVEANAGHATRRLPDDPVLPPEVLAVLRTAMEKRPHHRFSSAERMRAALARALTESDCQEDSVPYTAVPEPDVVDPALFGDPTDDHAGTLAPPLSRVAWPPPGAVSWPRVLALGALGVGLSVVAWTALVAFLSTFLRA